jgi:ArsR family transcriptional regulator
MLEEKIETVSATLKAISHPTRLKILCFLLDGEKTVGEISDAMETTCANVSQHLSILRNRGILESRKEANFIYNAIADRRVVELMNTLRILYCEE